MYKCPECGQSTKFYDLCNDCVDKFMKELDDELKDIEHPMWMYNFIIPNPFRFLKRKIKQMKGVK